LRLTTHPRNFADITGLSQAKPERDSLSAPAGQQPKIRDAEDIRKWREETLRKLARVLDLPKPMEDLSEEEQQDIFRRMTMELRRVSFNVDLPSPEERAGRPNPRTIRRCQWLCADLSMALPFDKDTASAGEVSDALLALAKQRSKADLRPKGFDVPEHERSCPPTRPMMRLAKRYGMEFSPTSGRGELADRLTERSMKLWRERRALARGDSDLD